MRTSVLHLMLPVCLVLTAGEPPAPAAVAGVTMPTPDGDLAPDFTWAGYPGGIPDVGGWRSIDITAFGAKSDDGADDLPAFDAAVAEAVRQPPCIVQIPKGTWDLDGAVAVRAGGVLFRGADRSATRIRLNRAQTSANDSVAIFDFRGAKKIDFDTRRTSVAAEAGATSLSLPGHAYAVDDVIRYEGPVMNWIMRVTGVNGEAITIDQPLRMPIAVGEGGFRKYGVIRNVAVERMTLETTANMMTNGINFIAVYGGWVSDVTIAKAGRHPIDYNAARYLTIRNCDFDETWNRGGGAQGYAGFWGAADCLMDNVTGRQMRHAPNLQGNAMGCVIRNSRWFQSDLQWHTGGPLANLVENNLIENDKAKPGFRVDQLARTMRPGIDKPTKDTIHSPAGPWNVTWHCDFIATDDATGVQFGGEHDNWLFAHNRVVIGGDKLPMMSLWKDCGRGFVIRDNVFATLNRQHVAGVQFELKDKGGDPGDRGVRFLGNRMYGYPLVDGKWWTGAGGPDVERDNRHAVDPVRADRVSLDDYPRQPGVEPSLYAWQMRQRGRTASR